MKQRRPESLLENTNRIRFQGQNSDSERINSQTESKSDFNYHPANEMVSFYLSKKLNTFTYSSNHTNSLKKII